MPSIESFSLERSAAPANQSDSRLTEVSDLELIDEENDALIGLGIPLGRSLDSEGCVDLLCLQTACKGVLLTLWCELTNYAREYAVPKDVLRAMVQCTFLAELDRGVFWAEVEDDPKPLTREAYLRVLRQAEQMEEERIRNAQHPYRVPDEKWKRRCAKRAGGPLNSRES
jgi:hypothetical protein